MTSIMVGQPVPAFHLPATSGKTLQLADFSGKNLVLYFYPKDSTPGCTTESRDFRDHSDDFAAHDTVILGISRDNLSSHEKFKGTECLPFELLSDSDETLCRQYDVIKEKNMYGKKVMGIERSTFLIDKHGILRREWRKVKVDGHVAEVLAAVQQL
jgi:thioredoxin-dependent peroxiredoxin